MNGRQLPSYEKPRINPKVFVMVVLYLTFVATVCGALMYFLFEFQLH